MRENSIDIELDDLHTSVTIKLANGNLHTFNVEEEIAIDKDDLNQNYIEQPGKYAWWGMVAEVAKVNVEEAKAKLEQVEAEADERVRSDLDMEGIKITESLVTRNIKKDKEYKEAQYDYFKAKKNAGILDKVLKAFDHRLDVLVNLGASMRKEYNNAELTVKKEVAKKVMKSKD